MVFVSLKTRIEQAIALRGDSDSQLADIAFQLGVSVRQVKLVRLEMERLNVGPDEMPVTRPGRAR